MTILPVSTSTASEKLRTILLVVATAVALSAGENEEIVGDVVSTVIDNAEEAEEVLSEKILDDLFYPEFDKLATDPELVPTISVKLPEVTQW